MREIYGIEVVGCVEYLFDVLYLGHVCLAKAVCSSELSELLGTFNSSKAMLGSPLKRRF